MDENALEFVLLRVLTLHQADFEDVVRNMSDLYLKPADQDRIEHYWQMIRSYPYFGLDLAKLTIIAQQTEFGCHIYADVIQLRRGLSGYHRHKEALVDC